MREIGVRELKASLSATLRRVARGEPVRVTMRGKPLADIVPAGSPAPDSRIRALIADGRLTPASSRPPARPPALLEAAEPASALVIADRDER